MQGFKLLTAMPSSHLASTLQAVQPQTVCCCLQPSALCSVVLGVCMAEVGVSIQHDANHGAYTRNTSLEYLLGTTLDMVGASSFMWKQQHVVGHHTYTNVEGLDPDIRVKDPDVRRVSQHQPWQSYQVSFSHVFMTYDLPFYLS